LQRQINSNEVLECGKRVLRHQADAILGMSESLDERFLTAVEWVFRCKSRVITCGIGKSGHIARKACATLASTGTPSHFLHAAEAVHGDLGMVNRGDVVIAFSQSGETDEIVRLFMPWREMGASSILISGRLKSSAARFADLTLSTGVTEESCSNNLAPTTSTTAMLALTDALAITVMERRAFTRDDFARLHPSGALGKRLLLRVRDVMRPASECAIVSANAEAMDVVRAMTTAGLGIACVVTEGTFQGIISEGDLRRTILKEGNAKGRAENMINRQPTTTYPDLLAFEALEIFQNHPKRIGEMPVLVQGHLAGVLALKDLLRSGIV
jgi:arabinose-5-phosphate isomerase